MAEIQRLQEGLDWITLVKRATERAEKAEAENAALRAERDRLREAQTKLRKIIDSYYGCEVEPRMAAFLKEFRAALAAQGSECATCRGTGKHIVERQAVIAPGRYGPVQTDVFRCPDCNGSGRRAAQESER